ncbi:MAG TPA: MMPL family transporter, partial [Stellaceae bacterium]|nr:MMPL family transporter [Stellaceae bacterium]
TDSVTTPYTIEILTPPNEVETLTRQLSALPEVAQIRSVMSFIPEDQSQKLAILNDAGTVLGPSLHPATTSAAPSEDEVLAEARHLAEDLQAIPGEKPPGLTRLISSLDRLQRSAAPLLGRNLGEGIAPLLGTLRLMFAAGNVTLETLPADIKRDWIAGDGRVLLEIVPAVDTRSNEALGRFSDEVRRIAPSATGTAVTIRESARSITRAFIIAGAAAFLAIALILWLTLRRWLDVVLVLVPLALAGLFTLATAALLGFALNFANIIALPILLGVGVAFDIYLVVRWREGKRDLLQSSTAHAILFSALTTATAFGSLALSSHLGTASMGKLLTLALFYTIATTFLVLPSLLAAFTPAREADGPG